MKIRIINQNDWEKTYDFDKSIIRVGSQVSCDIQLRDANIPSLLMQIVRYSGVDVRYVMRFFAENITLVRGNDSFPAETTIPYDLLDGDKITFGIYRMIISLDDEKKRTRTSNHIKAEMFLSKRELSLESPINGYVQMENLGTERACQFRMSIKGLPEECLSSAPLPYLYPGASSSAGFVISHLQTRPAPGFHTVSITMYAPDQYYGEVLEFNQDIYVKPVFENEMILEDDSEKLSDFNEEMQQDTKNKSKTQVSSPPVIQDSQPLNANSEIFDNKSYEDDNVRILGSNDSKVNPFTDPEEVDDPFSRRKKRQEVVVIRHEDGNGFDSEAEDEASSEENAEKAPVNSDLKTSKKVSGRKRKSDVEAEHQGAEDQGSESQPEIRMDEPEPLQVTGEKESEPAKNTVKEPAKTKQTAEKKTTEVPQESENSVPEALQESEPQKTKKKRKKKVYNVESDEQTDISAASSEVMPVPQEPTEPMRENAQNGPAADTGPVPDAAEEQKPISESVSVPELSDGSENAAKDNTLTEKPEDSAAAESDLPPVSVEPDNEKSESQVIFTLEPANRFEIPSVNFDTSEIDDKYFAVPEKMDDANNTKSQAMPDLQDDRPSGSDADVKKENHKPSEIHLVGSDGGDVNIPVIGKSNTFDDVPPEHIAEEIQKKETEKPTILVMKGGGFDE